ncbi:MAG: hypothetical protein OEW05_00790 [Candidatus Aminicenantes bacterium]|nr:hypothetical protein [Candidatus Aminicenantes bacterium]
MKPGSRPLKTALVRGWAPGAGLLFLAYGLVCWMIGSGVEDVLSRASRKFPGQGSDSLIAMVNSEEFPLKERNRAVWALGQLGDAKAVASLEALLTGKPCEHATSICQYELKKAIRQCRGAFNVARWAWKKFVL